MCGFFAAVVSAPFECCFFCVGVHPPGELDAGTTSACFDPLLTHRLPPSGRRGFLSNRRCSLLLLWGFRVRLPMRSIASLWRLLVAHVLLRVVRRRPRRSRASGRILLLCIHTVCKVARRCRFLVSPQWSACVVAGQSLVFSFRFLTIRTDRKSTRLNSSHVAISYAVFCLKRKKIPTLLKADHVPSH